MTATSRERATQQTPRGVDFTKHLEAAQAENDEVAEEQTEAAGESRAGSDADEVITEVDDEAAADIVIRPSRAQGTSVEGDTHPAACGRS